MLGGGRSQYCQSLSSRVERALARAQVQFNQYEQTIRTKRNVGLLDKRQYHGLYDGHGLINER